MPIPYACGFIFHLESLFRMHYNPFFWLYFALPLKICFWSHYPVTTSILPRTNSFCTGYLPTNLPRIC